MVKTGKVRFAAQLSASQKQLFERAAKIGEFRSLTEFVLNSAQQKADEIIERHNRIFASEQDKAVFFDAILNPPVPTEKLKSAVTEYRAKMHGS